MATEQWWTDRRIERAVTQDFITTTLDAKQRRVLKARVFDDELSDDTYQDVILTRARRCFLILRDIGHAELIFDLIDKNFTDDDLPIAGHDEAAWKTIASIRPRLDAKFDSRQYYYCLHEIKPGCHFDYTRDEVVPSVTIEKGIHRGVTNLKKVVINNETLLRRKYDLEPYTEDDGEQHFDSKTFRFYFTELGLLQHSHITRVWSTYTQERYGYVLLTPPSVATLKDALSEPAKFFKVQGKPEQRQILLRWAFCIASAVDYLHQHGLSHQAIRPGNVFLDSTLNLTLGEPAAFEDFQNARSDEYERLQYLHGSPEQWQRRRQAVNAASAMQSMAPSGGRTARANPVAQQAPRLAPSLFKRGGPKPAPKQDAGDDRPMSPLSVVPPMRTRLRPGSSHPSLNSSSEGSIESDYPMEGRSSMRPAQRPAHARGESYENPTRPRKALVSPLNFARLATSSSDQSPLFPSDIFAMATILIEILTTMMATTSSDFSFSKLVSHLGKRNRQAGRGGGGGAPVDSSFHANLDQAQSWLDKLSKGVADILHKAAKKRGKGKGKDEDDDSNWLHAAAELIELARLGIETDPRSRVTASEYRSEMVRINEQYALGAGQCCHAQAPALASSVDAGPTTRSNRMSIATSRSTNSSQPAVIEGFSPTTSRSSHSDISSPLGAPGPGPTRRLPRVPELPGDDDYAPVSPVSPPQSSHGIMDIANMRIQNRDRYAEPPDMRYHELPSPEPVGGPHGKRRDSDRTSEDVDVNESLYEYFSDDDYSTESPQKWGHRAKVPSLRDIPLPAAWKEKQHLAFGKASEHQRYGSIGQAM